MTSLGMVSKIAAFFIVIVIGLISFHAPLTVYISTLLPEFDLLVKSWKEILMCLAALMFLPTAIKTGIARRMLHDKLFVLISAFAVLHLIIMAVLYQGLLPSLAGIVIDLRYLLFFTLVYSVVKWRPSLRNTIMKMVFLASVVVIGFGFLQVVLLPRDILAEIGYSKTTIAPYLRVDENPAYIRINSTLRGPNPLGLYVAGWLTIMLSFFAFQRSSSRLKQAVLLLRRTLSFLLPSKVKWQPGVLLILTFMALVVLWHSYSRSSVVAAIVGLGIVVTIRYKQWAKQHLLAVSFSAILVCAALFVALQNSSIFQHVVFHNDPLETNMTNSDEGHAASLQTAWRDFGRQPLGAGIGSTGSASLFGNSPNIIENQYLFVGHETGWLGAGLFVAIFGLVLRRLLFAKQDYLSLGLFGSGVGLVIAGLVLPVFVDDTVAILWWGLAAVALASGVKKAKTL